TSPGVQTFRVVATDKDGGVSDPVLHTIDVVPAMVDDEGNLVVGGTSGSDRIMVYTGQGLMVRMNNQVFGPFSVGGEIIILGGAGNDTITFSGVNLPARIFGGADNDYITGTSGNDYVDGG